jgi:polyhydroxybutyrate depolymerase
MRYPDCRVVTIRCARITLSCTLVLACQASMGAESGAGWSAAAIEPLPVEFLEVQGLRRAVRFYQAQHLAARPALVIALHGGGGTGERFRLLTDRAFEKLADEQGFVVAYPDAIGGHWNGCRSKAPYHEALRGIDDIAFLRAVERRAEELVGWDLSGIFAVGYSNGGHMIFRLALETPEAFTALAAIAANLPVPEELDCRASHKPVSIFLVEGTQDPINPWAGGTVTPPGGGSLGQVLSAEATAHYFEQMLGHAAAPSIEPQPDRDAHDGTRVDLRRRRGEGHEVVLMTVHGGGHSLPLPSGHFPADIVGPTSRDLDGARVIWSYFAQHLDDV